LFADLERRRLLSFGGEGVVARVAAIPTEFARRLQRQIKRLVVGAIDQQHAGAKHQKLGHFRRRRRPRRQDHRRHSGGGSHSGQGSAGVAR